MSQPLILSRRRLNRATLARQLLLERSEMAVLEAIEHLVGLQAQNPTDPYIALWSRVQGFDAEELSTSLERREVVRAQLMRATIHMITASDHPYVAAVTASVLERVHGSTAFAKNTSEIDREELLTLGERLLDSQPRTRAELARALAERWPDVDATSVAQTVTYLLPLVQIPPRGRWGRSGQARWALAREWLGKSPDTDVSPDALILRYLAAFGPAAVADARIWSNLIGLAEVFDRLRPRLVVFRDEAGRELFDLPDAPRPDPDAPAPVRFLPEFDNALLSHADRSRVVVGVQPLEWLANLLVDGFLAGQWKRTGSKGRLIIEIEMLSRQPKRELTKVAEEAERLARFLAPDADHDVVVRPL